MKIVKFSVSVVLLIASFSAFSESCVYRLDAMGNWVWVCH